MPIVVFFSLLIFNQPTPQGLLQIMNITKMLQFTNSIFRNETIKKTSIKFLRSEMKLK